MTVGLNCSGSQSVHGGRHVIRYELSFQPMKTERKIAKHYF